MVSVAGGLVHPARHTPHGNRRVGRRDREPVPAVGLAIATRPATILPIQERAEAWLRAGRRAIVSWPHAFGAGFQVPFRAWRRGHARAATENDLRAPASHD